MLLYKESLEGSQASLSALAEPSAVGLSNTLFQEQFGMTNRERVLFLKLVDHYNTKNFIVKFQMRVY